MISKKPLERRLEALRAAGCLTSFAELEASARLPEGAQNAAALYERAFAAFVPWADETNAIAFGGAEVPERGVPLPESAIQTIGDFLASNRECLSLLREAAGIEDCRYDRTLAELVPHPDGLRMCATLLKLNSLCLGQQGDSNGVVLSVRDGLRLAASLRCGPVMITYFVRMNLCAVALKGLEWALSATDFTDRQLSELNDMLAATARTLDFAEVLAGERSYMIETYDDSPDVHGPMFYSPLLKLACVRRLDLMDNLSYMAEAIEASQLDGAQRLARFRKMEKKAARRSFLHVTIKMVSQSTTGLIEAELRLYARLLLTRTALAIERYRLMTGSVPDELEELVPQYLEQVPIDPFDGQPIRYRRMQPGYVLYSVDADGRDNGGRERDRDDEDAPYDLPFTVAR